MCRQGRGEANKGGRGEEREKQGEGEGRRDRRGRKEEGDEGGKVRVNQIEGEEGLYSESNSGRSGGEGGKSEGEVGEERGSMVKSVASEQHCCLSVERP